MTMAYLNELAAEIHDNAAEKGWWGEDYRALRSERGRTYALQNRNPLEVVALIHSEAAEVTEEIRDGSPLSVGSYEHRSAHGSYRSLLPENEEFTPGKPVGVPSEMADIIIRVLDACAAWKIDIDKAVREKIEHNKTRPYRHGGKKA